MLILGWEVQVAGVIVSFVYLGGGVNDCNEIHLPSVQLNLGARTVYKVLGIFTSLVG
jgi:hypothetical protein